MLNWGYSAKATREVDFSTPVKTKSEAMREYNRAYREKHSAHVQCGCGAVYKQISKYTHVKTARHVEWLTQSQTK